MSLTPTKELELGYALPKADLYNPETQEQVQVASLQQENGLLVLFICNHCPFVVHVAHTLKRIGDWALENKIGVVAISSNDVENYPADAPEKMVEMKKQWELSFPYLYDEDQQAAKDFGAECTPDISLFNSDGNCVYRGRLDGSRPGNDVVSDGKDIQFAMEEMLKGNIIANQKPSMGCNIKWK